MSALGSLAVVLVLCGLDCSIVSSQIIEPSKETADRALPEANIPSDSTKSDQRSRYIRLGLSVGVRRSLQQEAALLREASISPIDSTLHLDPRDKYDIVLAGAVVAYPFLTSSGWGRNIGFLVKLNIADFNSQSVSLTNKSIEGGLGLAYTLSDFFALGIDYEIVFSRKPRSYVFDGEKLYDRGEIVTSVNTSDERFFYNGNLSAVSVLFVYNF